MTNLQTKIESAKEETKSLQQQIEKAQKAKRDQTLSQAAKGMELAQVRGPPATKMRRTLKGHFGRVTALHWGGDSQLVVSASQDGNLLIWNAVTSNKLQSITLKSSYVMSVGMEQTKNNLIACGGLDNLCTIYRRDNPTNAMEMASHDGFLSCCRFLDEKNILTSSGDSTCILWDITTSQPVSTFAEHKADAMFLALKPDDANVFVSCSVDSTAKVWDKRTPDRSVQTFVGHVGDVNSVDFMTSEPNCFATCGQDLTVRLFDLRAYNQLGCWGGGATAAAADPAAGQQTEALTSVSFSRSGRIVFAGHTDGNVLAYDVLADKTTPAFTLAGAHTRSVSCLGVSPMGNALCTGSWDSMLKIWA